MFYFRLSLVLFSASFWCCNLFSNLPLKLVSTKYSGEKVKLLGIKSKQMGYILYDTVSKKIVVQHNVDKLFIPASSLKILTSIFGLKILGEEFRFETVLKHTGKIRNGILEGDLCLIGGGDPFITISDLMTFALSLKSKGVRQVRGKFYYDDFIFPVVDIIDENQKEQYPYNPAISALSFEFNRFVMTWKSVAKPRSFQAFGVPSVAYKDITPSGHNANLEDHFLYSGNGRWNMASDLHRIGKIDLPVKGPSLLFSKMFLKCCQMVGIKIGKPGRLKTPSNAREIIVHKSKKLSELVDMLLEYSNNVMAELIMLRAAQFLSGSSSLDIVSSAKLMKKWYQEKFPKINFDSMILKNGSGLSTDSRISARQMFDLLKSVDSLGFFKKEWIAFLPVSGMKGSLKRRLLWPDTATKIWAKQGSIYYVSALAGYLFDKSNKKYIFVQLFADIKNRKRLDSNLSVKEHDRHILNGKQWMKNARTVQDNFLRAWIANRFDLVDLKDLIGEKVK